MGSEKQALIGGGRGEVGPEDEEEADTEWKEVQESETWMEEGAEAELMKIKSQGERVRVKEVLWSIYHREEPTINNEGGCVELPRNAS